MSAQHVLITGTTSGIGCSLLSHYVQSGARVTSVNRRPVSELEIRYPQVQFKYIDVQDTKNIANLISDFASNNDLPDLFVLNAGINRVDNDVVFNLEEFLEVLNTNLIGVMNFVAPLISLRSWPRRTTVLAISSMTNHLPNPYCLGYYVSKEALTKSFDLFAGMYEKTNLRFKCMVLGPVSTAITTTASKFPKIMSSIRDLFSISQDKTVRALVNFAESNRGKLIYPKHALFLFQAIRSAQWLIPGLYRGRKTLEGAPRGIEQPAEKVIPHAKR